MASSVSGQSNEKIALRIAGVVIVLNLLLASFKFFAGIAAKSDAMVSDAFHSATDIITTIIMLIGIKIASKEADDKHPYGYERFECIFSMILAAVVAAVGLGIGYSGMQKVISGNYNTLEIPGVLALAAALVSIVVKEGMFWYTRWGAKKIDSGALMADAWHNRADALSSVGSFLGILGARMGYPVLDPLAGVLIALFILKAAFDIFTDAIKKVTDNSCDPQVVEGMKEMILRQNGVGGIGGIKTRLFASRVFVDVVVLTDGNQTLNQAHSITRGIQNAMAENYPKVKHCTVQLNPLEE
ncbi:cation diffusion facilitator family transporter [Breznakiella homolactica]|uniref:Cation transporter n=1 Tax=Breznakiella homolactica TaxID=2798577 RepID=A0A7T8BA90_9SPIR|nr:cation diffusion facilitator family transporter [Breznakiella homolactica]QQO09126.1 cation diffusion facilitator family transporter [Breznakiella homolactica]